MQREQHWEGLRNTRDLGGLPTPYGETKFGRVFRSPRPEWLTPAGWAAASEAGVRTVIDLRNDTEVPTSDRPASIVTHRQPIEDQSDEAFMTEWGGRLGSPAYYAENLRRWPDKVVRVFERVADAPTGVLVHCAAGRDRTGLITAMLLRLADVEINDVVDDYELSVQSMNGYVHPGERAHERVMQPEQLEGHVVTARAAMTEFLGDLDVTAWLATSEISAGRLRRLQLLLR